MVGRSHAAASLLCLLLLAGCSGGGGDGEGGAGGDGGDGGDGPGRGSDGGSTAPQTQTSGSATGTTSPASSSASSSTTASPAPVTVEREVQDNSFPDGTFQVRVGDTVLWRHTGNNPHSVTSDDNFDSHPLCPPVCMLGGDEYEHTFDTVGTFAYRCKVHGSMTGTITVV